MVAVEPGRAPSLDRVLWASLVSLMSEMSNYGGHNPIVLGLQWWLQPRPSRAAVYAPCRGQLLVG